VQCVVLAQCLHQMQPVKFVLESRVCGDSGIVGMGLHSSAVGLRICV
jgi:hypothetical protein